MVRLDPKLHRSITAKNYVLSALEASLVHLDTPLPLSLVQPTTQEFVERFPLTGYAIDVFHACVSHCTRTPGILESTVSIILSKFEEIIDSLAAFAEWALRPPADNPDEPLPSHPFEVDRMDSREGELMSLFDDPKKIVKNALVKEPLLLVVTGVLVSKVLHAMCARSASLEDAVFASPKAIRLALRLWATPVAKSGVETMSGVESYCDDAAHLMQNLLNKEHGSRRDELFNQILASRARLDAFVKALVGRFDQLVRNSAKSTSNVRPPPETELVWHCMRYLSASICSHRSIWRALVNAGVLKVWTRAIVMTIGDSTCPKLLELCIGVISAAVVGESNQWVALRDIFKEGLLPTILRILVAFDAVHDQEKLAAAREMPRQITRFVFNAKVIAVLFPNPGCQ
ncbi:hypothetical protein CC1G_15633 [Coprinopsis cinerea okayama7|uniref:Uncharacterized protein n=1 Tax=Coprinopsis cinerea (strain Okayama-7 / 130 / ATCC MYA-4618 / FGSC 9003) TaxID=240176 RepID=D6RN84_COPC7|nr:hypothetical protein CC1G_15633 [Coprinopsis cinerea okayama7\|eukprot:XP_002911091.1 hypothetical protein CC1G_15633 [Coprinopsis cinerea okayama7\